MGLVGDAFHLGFKFISDSPWRTTDVYVANKSA